MSLDSTVAPKNGVLILSGYAIRVAVERGHLVVEDGVGRSRRSGRFARASRDIRRLVVIGHTGTISFDALRWLADIGASLVQVDSDGSVIAANGARGVRDSRLRRAQALAWGNEAGLIASKSLIVDKVKGQRSLIGLLPESGDVVSVFESAIGRIPDATDVDRLRLIEAEAAIVYWKCWSRVPVQFARNDLKSVPTHWKTFGKRASLVTGRSRKASNPANAMLNYLYAIIEAEAKIAAVAVGCDPGLGVMHADERSRDSLACDLMEPVRPKVDRFLLDLLSSRVFRKQDFFETREGVCRVMPPISNLLAETAPRWAREFAPIAEQFAHQVSAGRDHKSKGRSQPTPLTQSNRSAGRRSKKAKATMPPRSKRSVVSKTCVVCGSGLKNNRKKYCADCKFTQTRDAVTKAHASLRAKREAGDDPAHGGEAARRRGKRTSEALYANAQWERAHSAKINLAEFGREIFPNLGSVSLSQMMQATGLSRSYCAMIRRGVRVPHPRNWTALRTLVPGDTVS